MNLHAITRLIDIVGDATRRHAPLVLAASAIAGVVGTAALSAKAGIKAHETMKRVDPVDGEHPTVSYIKNTWQTWLVPVATCALTATSIVLLHSTHKKRYAALMGLYVLGDKAFQEYRDSVEEVVSKKDKTQIREKQAEKLVSRLENEPVQEARGGDTLVYDAFSGRAFRSDMETLRAAVNEFNHNLIMHNYGTVNEFYSLLSLEGIGAGEDLGWNSDYLLEMRYEASFILGSTEPAICMEFRNKPSAAYYHNH